MCAIPNSHSIRFDLSLLNVRLFFLCHLIPLFLCHIIVTAQGPNIYDLSLLALSSSFLVLFRIPHVRDWGKGAGLVGFDG